MLTSSPSFPCFRFYICGINVIHDSSAISVGFPGSSSSSHEWIFDMFIPSPLFKSITATTDYTDWLIKKNRSTMLLQNQNINRLFCCLSFCIFLICEICLICGSPASRFNRSINRDQRFQQAFHVRQPHRVRPVAQRLVGIGVSFGEDAGYTHADRSPCQHRNKLAGTA